MKKDIVVPAAGESVTEADIAEWKKENGAYVRLDEAIVELETDKASLDLTAEAAGTLCINISEGETVKVGERGTSVPPNTTRVEGCNFCKTVENQTKLHTQQN